ncbi:MAG: thiol reductant ABC exporter subunit CydD [Pseudonocardiaceae bacterium]
MLRRRSLSALPEPTAHGPLGALPALSAVARRALAVISMLSLLGAGLLVLQAFMLASVLASMVDGRANELSAPLLVLVVVVAGRALVGWATRVVSARAAVGVKEELRARTVDHALTLGPEWIAARGIGELTSLATRGLDALDGYFTEYLPALVTACVVPLAVGAAILFADWPSAVIIALTVPLLPMFAILVGKHTADRVSSAADAVHRLSGHLLELVRALPVLTAFGRADAQAESVRRVSDRHRRTTVDTLKVAFSSAFTLELIATLSVALVAVVIGVRLVSGEMSLAIALGVLLLAPECYQPLRAVGAAFHASEDGLEAVRRVGAVLAEGAGRPAPSRERAGRSAPDPELAMAGLRVSELRVDRRGGYAPDGASFEARRGEITWLNTPSGAGKSTTLAVLLGFVRPSSGTVTVGGIPLADRDLSTWRRSVAWVPQFPILSADTVRDELAGATADIDAEPSAADIEQVTGKLAIHDLLEREPSELSTGQRQRVAVARALLRVRHSAWLLLLDEPTAHVDETNAARVMAAIREAADAGAAVVLAAHTAADAGALPAEQHAEGPPGGSGPSTADPEAAPLPLQTLLDGRLLGGVALGALSLIAGVALTATSGWLIAKASQQPPILTLTVAIVGVRLFGLGRATLRYLERLATHDAAFRAATRLRVRLWLALARLGPARTLGLRSGEGQRRLVDDIDTVRDLVPRVLTPPLVVGVVSVCAVLALTLVLPAAGAVLAVAVALGGLIAMLVSFRVERRAASALAEGRRTVRAQVLVLLDAAAELLAFGGASRRRAELAASDHRLTSLALREAWGGGVAGAMITLATGAAAVGCAWVAGKGVAAGELDPVLAPLLVLVPLALAEVLALLPPVAAHAETLRQARSRLAAVFDPAGSQCGVRDIQRPQRHIGDIRLNGVSVRWPDAAQPALHEVDLHVPAGTQVAVLGPSGAGKSTLLATLLGFLTPERGTACLPEHVVWAPQEPQLVSTTLAENLRLGDPHATDEQLADVLRAVCLGEFTDRLHVVLGSAGAGLSGGQAGRVSLARALLAAERYGHGVVLLDEPTAHLDADTASTVLGHLRSRLAGHTVVHVTHRPEETHSADLILDVQHGRVQPLVSVYGPQGGHFHARGGGDGGEE